MMRRITMVALLLGLLAGGAAPLPRTDDAVPALREDRWDDALPLLKSVVAANPFEGRARYYLGVTYQGLERHGEAVAEFRAALELGVYGTRSGMRAAHVALARGLAATGDVDGALAHLEEAWAYWGFDGLVEILGDQDFASLHEDPRLRGLAGLDPQADAGDRAARWQADIRYLRRLLAVAHPEPFHSIEASRWNAAADRLDRDVARSRRPEPAVRYGRGSAVNSGAVTNAPPPVISTRGGSSPHQLRLPIPFDRYSSISPTTLSRIRLCPLLPKDPPPRSTVAENPSVLVS